MKDRARPRHISEAVKIVEFETYIDRAAFYCPDNYLVVSNGVLDLDNGELLPFNSDTYALSALPAIYDPDADCPNIKKFLCEVVSPGDILVLQELAGYLLESGYPYGKAFMLVGDGRNGKTVFLDLIIEFLGIRNVSSVALQNLGGLFAVADLYGKLANICDDLSDRDLQYSGSFKKLTGDSLIWAQKKFRDPFSFMSRAKLVFAANRIPKVKDDSYAYFSRWIIVRFPNQFVDGLNADPHLKDRLTTPEELSGFLNWALEGLRRIRKNKGFSKKMSAEEVQRYYQRLSDSVAAFCQDRVVRDASSEVSKKAVHTQYIKYCETNGLVAILYQSFCKRMKERGYKETRKTVSGMRVQYFRGLKTKTART